MVTRDKKLTEKKSRPAIRTGDLALDAPCVWLSYVTRSLSSVIFNRSLARPSVPISLSRV